MSYRLGCLLPAAMVLAFVAGACGGSSEASASLPVVTPLPLLDPTAEPTPEPTAKPLAMGKLALTATVDKGDTAKVSVKTAPAADCTIKVTYASGESQAAGLNEKTADAAGKVSWSWTVGLNTAKGKFPIDIYCFKGEREGTLTLMFTVR